MKLIYNNFDGLDISFQGILPERVLNRLAAAREQAQQEKRDIPLELSGRMVLVGETGMQGGYRYRFDTGPDGETWALMHSTNSDVWGIRISAHSWALAQHGYEGVKERILTRLKELDAIGPSRIDDNGEITNFPLERISRFDYCFDFIMDGDFQPIPQHFVAHQRTNRHVYGEQSTEEIYAVLNGDRVKTVRLGEMPGREATLYNKTLEVFNKNKGHWWHFWDIQDQAPFKERLQQIWRIEVRAGGTEIKKWEARRFKDFEEKYGDIIPAILKAMCLKVPLRNDAKKSRWPYHPIWQAALTKTEEVHESYRSNAKRSTVMNAKREDIERTYNDRFLSGLIGTNVMKGRNVSDIHDSIEELKHSIDQIFIEHPELIEDRNTRKQDELIHFL